MSVLGYSNSAGGSRLAEARLSPVSRSCVSSNNLRRPRRVWVDTVEGECPFLCRVRPVDESRSDGRRWEIDVGVVGRALGVDGETLGLRGS